MSAEAALEHNYGQQLAKPLHIQRVENALKLEPFLGYVESILTDPIDDSDTSIDGENGILRPCPKDSEGNKMLNGITVTRADNDPKSEEERKADKTRLYNFSKVKKSRKWLKNILLSDSSSDEEDERPLTNDQLQMMLKARKYQRKHQLRFYQDPELHQYQYYSAGLLSNYDKYPEHYKSIVGPKKKISKESKKVKGKLKRLKREQFLEGDEDGNIDPSIIEAFIQQRQHSGRHGKHKKLTPEQADAKRKRIWSSIAKKEIPKAQKQKASLRKEQMATLKKLAQHCVKDGRRCALSSQKVMKETPPKIRRVTREMQMYWKRFERFEKEHRKKAEKEAQEQRKLDMELREARRQQRKLNFLITQTELYAHFMARKMTGGTEADKTRILKQLEEKDRGSRSREVDGGVLVDINEDDYDSNEMKLQALQNAESAYRMHQAMRKSFDEGRQMDDGMDLSISSERPQPSMFEGTLKGYQLKGMNWLIDLYNKGINGILADEMGLGKTVQSIALLAHLAESQGIWGPFLVIAPASTLHNWQQECARFVSKFKVVPYWGSASDRRIMRKFWEQRYLHTESASFHVVITSYQIVVQDIKYFQRIKWQYMVLDEAQAIKSSASVRWKSLHGFSCRNRLLLTGTPIQNSMAELWALLHFIMPTLFDSHEEFNEWFSKDIESHVERQSGIDEDQLSRLHMILKPFMLRRVKKDVENELSDKIEILVYCPLTTRQRMLYQAVKNKISIEDLLYTSMSNTSQASSTTSSLMNLVMQFRKICNHPDLFERKEPRSPFYCGGLLEPYLMPKLLFREGQLETALPSKQRTVYNLLYIHNPANVTQSLHHSSTGSCNSTFSFTRFIGMSPEGLHSYMSGGLLVRWLGLFLWLKYAYRIHISAEWEVQLPRRHVGRTDFLLEPLSTTHFANLWLSPCLRQLVFTHPGSCLYTHQSHTLHYMAETAAHRQMRLKNQRLHAARKLGSPSQSPTKSLSPVKSPKKDELFALHHGLGHQHGHLQAHSHGHHHGVLHSHSHHHGQHHGHQHGHQHSHMLHLLRSPRVFRCQPTDMPRFLDSLIPKVHAEPLEMFCSDNSAARKMEQARLCGTLEARNSLLYGSPELYFQVRLSTWQFCPSHPGGLLGARPRRGFSRIVIPDKDTLVTDAGKLSVLDSLLARLKREGHRVLIYSQMTRMIDILEEYMWYRKHTYMRLDGSSKISDRRDMVADFQARSDIFVFLLSTRAGGLGINLTAADTVIFYDSDWNPTVDQQAMDRAHRLGQTKQVTVYRLICKGTIEERILQRAREKSEIQNMVIAGGNFKTEVLKPKEVVSLLIDDAEMENKLRQRQDEKRSRDATNRQDRKRKREYKKRGRGRSDKRSKHSDVNVTIPAPDSESLASFESMSMPASPQSEMSFGSELLQPHLLAGTQEDSSNDGGLVIVDDAHTTFPPVTSTPVPPPKRGRGRGRPRGSGAGRGRGRGRGGAKKALTAAEIAGAQAGMTAAYAAYGYNFTGTGTSSPRTPGSLPASGRSTPSV